MITTDVDVVAAVAPAADTLPVDPPARRSDLGWVLILTCFVTALNVAWALQNQAPPTSDDNSHLYIAVRMLAQVSSSRSPLSLLLLYPGHYPPLTYQVTYAFYRLFGEAPWVNVASFFPFLLIMGLSLYGIGARLGNRWTGLLCAVAGLCAPVVLEHARTYFVDLPATAALALSVCAVLYCRDFASRPWSLAFGLSMAIGMLSKWTHPAFVMPFLLVAMYGALSTIYAERWPGVVVGALMAGTVYVMARHVLAASSPVEVSEFTDGPAFRWPLWWSAVGLVAAALCALRRGTRARPNLLPLANMLEAFALSALLSWPWYYHNGERVREKIIYQSGVQIDFWQGVTTYIQDVSVMVYNAPLLLAAGLAVGLSARRTRRWTALLAIGITFAISLNALLPPDSRYVMPAVILVVPLALVWLATLPPRINDTVRRHAVKTACASLAGVVAVTCLWQASAFACQQSGFGTLEGPRRVDTRHGLLHLGITPVLPADPKPGVYPYEEVLGAIRTGDRSEHTWVAVLESQSDAATLQPRTFLYHAARQGLDLLLIETTEDIGLGRDVRDIEQVRTFLLIYRFDTDRARLRAEAARRHWIDPDVRPSKVFTFSPAFHVEIFPRAHAPGKESGSEAGTQ